MLSGVGGILCLFQRYEPAQRLRHLSVDFRAVRSLHSVDGDLASVLRCCNIRDSGHDRHRGSHRGSHGNIAHAGVNRSECSVHLREHLVFFCDFMFEVLTFLFSLSCYLLRYRLTTLDRRKEKEYNDTGRRSHDHAPLTGTDRGG